MILLIIIALTVVFVAGMVVGERVGIRDTEQRWHDAAVRTEDYFKTELTQVRADLQAALQQLHLASSRKP